MADSVDERTGAQRDGAAERPDASLLLAAPGLVRLAAAAWWRSAGWTVETSIRAGDRVVRAAVTGEPLPMLLADVGANVRDYVREVLGIFDDDDRRNGEDDRERDAHAPRPGVVSLRKRGAELLRQSADVRFDEEVHPAFPRILEELAPDEGRILRLLALEGAQPAVDVRGGKPLVPGSQMVAPGLTMIGPAAGCRYLERVPAYLNNLYRLGLIWFLREPLEDPVRYQVLEAQPDVLAAMRGTGRARTVRRSIDLTPFGADFCETCLPLNTAELDALPGDVAPDGPLAASKPQLPGAGPPQ